MKKLQAVFFPFDLFGSPGTRVGAELFADAVREMLDDNKREKKPTRARAYANKVRLEEWEFSRPEHYQSWRTDAFQQARKSIEAGDFLFWASGNHLGVLPIYEVLAHQPDVRVVQFDAHLDVFHLSDCTSDLSHGNFLMHAESLPPIFNVGHRDLLLPAPHVARYFADTIPASDLAISRSDLGTRLDTFCQGRRVFVDLDCDVFDAAYFPAIAHPQPLGVSPHVFLQCMEHIGWDRIIGLSISEFDPAKDDNDRSLSTLLWLFEYALLRLFEK